MRKRTKQIGNNGKVTYAPAIGLSIEKQLSDEKPGDGPVFIFGVPEFKDDIVDSSFYVIEKSAEDAPGGITYDTAQYNVFVDVND